MYQSPERLSMMMEAVQCTAKMRSRMVTCPQCGHPAFRVYEGTIGYLETKCKSCKKIVTYNLLSMRRVRNYSEKRIA